MYVVGAGAVGTFLGDLLRSTGATVSYAPRALHDVVPARAELAIVAVKAYDTPAAIETLRRAFGDDASATILTPQNGVGNEEALAAAFGADRVVSCALTVPLERGADGAVVAAHGGGIALAPVGTIAHNWLIAAFERGPVAVKVTGDYRSLKWSKLALNIIANAGCAILDVLPRELVALPDVFALEILAIREARTVMAALNVTAVDLPRYPVRALFAAASLPMPLACAILRRRVAGARGSKPPSLLLDVRAGKDRTEIDVLNGAIVQEGRRLGIATPVNSAYVGVLAELARSWNARAAERGKPARLLVAVAAEIRASEAAARTARANIAARP